MKFRCSQAFVSQIWRRLILILMVTQVILITAFFLVGVRHVGSRLGSNQSALMRLVDIVFSQADPVLIRPGF